MSSPTYFITGAAGFVGRHLCARLRARGSRVIALTRRPDAYLEQLGVEPVYGDLADIAAWKPALAGIDYLIHCAAYANFTDKGDAHAQVNIEGTRQLLTAIRDANPHLRRFVFISTIGAVDRQASDACSAPLDENSLPAPSSAYGRSKVAAEQLVRASVLPFCIVRPAMVVGADMRHGSHFSVFTRAAVQGSAFARIAWPGAFSVVHVSDLAAALELCATHPETEGRTFFCSGTSVRLDECFKLASPDRLRIPPVGLPTAARLLPSLVPFRAKALLLPALTASDAPLRALGWQPQYDGASALEAVIARERARADPALDPGGQTVVTGAASGLGRALVEALAPRRRQLLLVDRDAAGLSALQTRFPHCRTHAVDLGDEAALAALTRSSEWKSAPVLELFACAGIGLRGPVLAHAPERHAALFKVNILARLTLAHAALADMTRAQFGRIVFISSSSAFQPLPFMASYAASNSALLSLGEAWGSELAGTGVHLLSVCPGGMQTNFQTSAGVKRLEGEKLMPPEAVADQVLRALAAQKPTAIISTRAHGMAFVARLLPRRASVALWKKLMAKLR